MGAVGGYEVCVKPDPGGDWAVIEVVWLDNISGEMESWWLTVTRRRDLLRLSWVLIRHALTGRRQPASGQLADPTEE